MSIVWVYVSTCAKKSSQLARAWRSAARQAWAILWRQRHDRRLRKVRALCMGVVVALMVAVVALMNGLFLAPRQHSLDGILAFLTRQRRRFSPPGTAKETPPAPRGFRQRGLGRRGRQFAGSAVHHPPLFPCCWTKRRSARRQRRSIAAVSGEEAVLYAQRRWTRPIAALSERLPLPRRRDGRGALVVFLDASTQLATARDSSSSPARWRWGLSGSLPAGAAVLRPRRARPHRPERVEKQRQFITDAGHELKTPLTIISANCEVLEMEMEKNE